MSTASPPLQAPTAGGSALGRILNNPKWLITILITSILLAANFLADFRTGPGLLAATLGSAVITEMGFSAWIRGGLYSVQSAYISGVSMTILTKPQQGLLWPYVLGAAVSIASKYVFTWRGRHIWNPTNFGISVMLLIAPGSVSVLSSQFGNGNATLMVIWVVGALVASRARILHVTFSYLAAFLVLAYLRTLITGNAYTTEIAPITGPMYQLFLFFMITDPPTTVRSRKGRIFVAVLIAVVESAIRLTNEFPLPGTQMLLTAPPIFALAIVGPIAKIIDLELAHGEKQRKEALAA